jgi:hypothetical protein
LILAYWITQTQNNPARRSLLEKINTAFVFASPIFLQQNTFELLHPTKDEFLYVQLGDYFKYHADILRTFPRVAVAYCKDDPMATRQEASFTDKFDRLGGPPLEELEIPDCKHDTICSHDQAINFVMKQINQTLL